MMIEVQSSGDSSHPYPIESLEPGISLANALGERIFSNERIPLISSMLSNTDSERQSLNDLENIKYKTELCRNYSAYGFCSYSSRCQFAHGLEELRCRARHPKYKTEFCRNFLSGFCKYGSRCQFLHDSHNTNETLPSKDSLTTPPSTILYPTAAALGTYLLTNMLGHSSAFGLGRPITDPSVLATLASYANLPSKPTSTEYSVKRSTIPLHCGIEMQQISPLHFYHGISIPQNQNNNNNSQLSDIKDNPSSRLQNGPKKSPIDDVIISPPSRS